MHCLFQKSHLVPLCHCLQEEKGRLKSIILTCASLMAQELNSTSSAPNRSQDLMAANGGTSQQVLLSWWRRQAVWSVCVQWERSDVCAWARWMPWLGSLHVWGNFCGAGAFKENLWEHRWGCTASSERGVLLIQLSPALRWPHVPAN